MVCDHISLVDNVNDTTSAPDIPQTHAKYDDSIDPNTVLKAANFSNRNLVSDWDVLAMISTTITDLPFPLTITHVKGHQDKKTAYQDLSLLAQLNVDADKLAGRFQTLYGAPRPTVLRFPVNTVQFNLHHTHTITYKLKSVLYHEASAPELQQYIADQNGWDEEDMNLIDWKAHGHAITRQILPPNHTVKLVHNILPTNYQVN